MELKKIIQRTPPPGPLPELREGEQCESHLIKAKTFAYLTPRPPLQYLERGRKTHLEVPSPCNGEGI